MTRRVIMLELAPPGAFMVDESTEIHRLRRAYLALAESSAQVVRASTEQEVVDAACRCLVEVGGYRLAGVSYRDGESLRRIASAGRSEDQAYLTDLPFSLSSEALRRGPSGVALLTGQLAVNRDSEHNPAYAAWRARALQHGFRSSIALPLLDAGTPFGVLSVYATTVDAFDTDEQELLTRLANGVAFGVLAMRTRAALAAKEAAVGESELRFRQLAESIDDVFWLTDLETGAILYVSPAYETIWGRSREGLYASRTAGLDALHPEDRDRVAAALPLQRDGDWQQEYRIVRPDGSVRWIRDRCYLVRDASGRVHRFAGCARDITEQRHLEEQLRQSQKMQAVGQLAGGIAHDFNNLLLVVQSHAGFALDALDARDPIHTDLSAIASAADRAADLTKQLLAFGRRQVLRPRAIDLNEELLGLERMLRRVIGEQVELTLRTFPGAAPVFVDPSQLGQIVVNLAVNARDAMPVGGRLLLETVAVERTERLDVAGDEDGPRGPMVLLEVSDTGVGMDAATRERIFEPFFTTKEHGKGTGLGLSTVFGIVKQSHGHVTVESEAGRGTTFKVYLPRTDRPVEAPPARLPAASRVCGSETILLVEDADPVRRLTHTLLRRQGYDVLEAADGVEAVRVSADHGGEIALLLTDVVMPRMSGKELATRLSALRPRMRVLYVSGYDEAAAGDEDVRGPGVAFLQKPMRPDVLLRKVRELLDVPRASA